jgi:TolA-binding protein
VVELVRQLEGVNAEIARLRGQLEVLANENQQIQKRQRDFYLDLDSRLKRLEGGPGDERAAGGSGRAPRPRWSPRPRRARPRARTRRAR